MSEFALPHEFKDLDAVHISPIVDLGRLLFILVTRSIVLSNTQYSFLLDIGGKLVNLGSEWIGARVKYQKRAICFSEMLADDIDYTDYWGVNNDECEYFINGFVVNDRIYLQSYVFDTTFELEMDFHHIELEFNQLEENNKLHVSSNPYFAFHDDVFPLYAKNQVTQEKYNSSAADKITVVPDNYFISMTYFDHISSVLLESVDFVSFVLKKNNSHSILSSEKILDLRLSSGENLLSVNLIYNGNLQFSSDFLEDKLIDVLSFDEEDLFEIDFNFENGSIRFQDANNNVNIFHGFTFSEKINKKKEIMRIYKYSGNTAVKNCFVYRNQEGLRILNKNLQNSSKLASLPFENFSFQIFHEENWNLP